jgi:hypothetical protein
MTNFRKVIAKAGSASGAARLTATGMVTVLAEVLSKGCAPWSSKQQDPADDGGGAHQHKHDVTEMPQP